LSQELFIRNRQRLLSLNGGYLQEITGELLLDLLRVDHFDLGVYIVRASEMTRLNETFLRHSGSTDVITFDYGSEKMRAKTVTGKPETRNPKPETFVHGEIFVCIDEAIVQGRRYRATWQSELTRYVLHGILHLRGHDDARPAARRKMKREESRLLRQLSARYDLRKLGR
jgi:probable rRNA maturation factor